MTLRLLFAGTPDFAVPSLRAALEGGDVLAVLTQPDRPAGRGRHPQASPVKQVALEHGVPVLQPESLRHADVQAQLAAFAPDLLIVVAYGLILPQAVLDIPRFGAWNVHASLLPRWRGAAPIQRAIEAGDAETGVCLMQMEKGLDTGPVLLHETTPIALDDTGGSLHDRLAQVGAETLAEGLAQLRESDAALPSEIQDHVQATYAHKLDKAEARLDWQRPAVELARKVRAFSPWPVAEATLDGERLRIHRAVALEGGGEPGQIIAAGRDGIDVACGDGVLRLLDVQRDGGKTMAAANYLNARSQLRR
ncbi:methionyl-tRNA formyltransferase [Xanthomonadaceae bacterium XH05]|nr:methionyl-tRNA formyltransferase [Xanthomonadaceae bacterium XH05]